VQSAEIADVIASFSFSLFKRSAAAANKCCRFLAQELRPFRFRILFPFSVKRQSFSLLFVRVEVEAQALLPI
jgi:hypothetical protein